MSAQNPVADEAAGLSPAGKRLLVIGAYYLAVGVAVALAEHSAPGLLDELAGNSISRLVAGTELVTKGAVAAASQSIPGTAREQARATLLALAGALITALPVSLVYSLTRRRKGFDQSMVHVLLLLPIAVAGMVVLIQNNLALAFSLAGIVAVLRFRNSLEDVKDGVFVFVSVSIGMSAAVGALAIGFVTSVVFNVWTLLLWWLDFAHRPTPELRGRWRSLARLPKVAPLKPVEEEAAAAVETGEQVFASAARAWRRQLQITAEHAAAAPEKGFNATVRIHTNAPDRTRPVVEEILTERAKRWELTGVVPEGGAYALKYLVRVKRDDRSALLEALQATPDAIGVELR